MQGRRQATQSLGELDVSTETITTLEQLWEHPPEGRCELVRGELRMMSPSGGEHAWVVASLTGPLVVFVKANRLGYVFGAEGGFIIERDPDTVRAPDVAFVRRERVAGHVPREFFPGSPDLAVEVLSPSDSASAVHEKAEQWLNSGCREVWLIDPRRKSASVCTLAEGALVLMPVQRLTSELLPGFELPVEELFAD